MCPFVRLFAGSFASIIAGRLYVFMCHFAVHFTSVDGQALWAVRRGGKRKEWSHLEAFGDDGCQGVADALGRLADASGAACSAGSSCVLCVGGRQAGARFVSRIAESCCANGGWTVDSPSCWKGQLWGGGCSFAVCRPGEGEGVSCVAAVRGGVRSTRLGPLWAVQMHVIVSLGRNVAVRADGGGRAQPETMGAGSLMRVVSRVVRGGVCARRWVRAGSSDAAIFGGWSPPILIVSRTFCAWS